MVTLINLVVEWFVSVIVLDFDLRVFLGERLDLLEVLQFFLVQVGQLGVCFELPFRKLSAGVRCGYLISLVKWLS